MRSMITESMIKLQIKDYLDKVGIFSFPLTAGLGSYRGLPDRVLHLDGKVVYLEIKKPKAKLSIYQQAFQMQCLVDEIEYWVIHSIEELQEKLSGN